MVILSSRTPSNVCTCSASSPGTLTRASVPPFSSITRRNATSDARLRGLSSSAVDHTWLWKLNPHKGPYCKTNEFVDAVRVRLGCAGPTEPTECAAYNAGLFDIGAAHASCCALVSGSSRALSSAPPMLLALCNTRTALRVSISAPHAQAGVASTATQTRVADKLAHYGPTSNHPPRPEDQLHRRPLERLWQTPLLHVDCFPYSRQVHLSEA